MFRVTSKYFCIRKPYKNATINYFTNVKSLLKLSKIIKIDEWEKFNIFNDFGIFSYSRHFF